MQKLPEASDRKRGDACVKKKGPPDKRRKLILFSAVTGEVITPCKLVGDATRSSLDDALASPFTSSSPSRLTVYQNIRSYEMDLSNYELKHWTWTNSQKRLTRY